MRVVFGDRVGDLVQRPEAGFDPVGHEGVDPVRARLIHVRHDVDQHDGAGDAR
jgi:hypothetical protein